MIGRGPLAFVLTAIILLSGPWCGVSPAGEVRLGMSAAFSGPSRGLGIELYRGAAAYFEHVNSVEGGLFGQKIVIEPKDDGYNPSPAIMNTIEFIKRRDILLLFNYVGTPTVTRVLPLLKKYSDSNTYMFFPFTGAQPQRERPYCEYVFNLRASYRQELKELVDRLHEAGRVRVALFCQADAYGRSGWEGAHKALDKYGLDILVEATYRRGAKFNDSMVQQVAGIKSAEPDVVISVGSYEACAAFIRDARDMGLDVPICNVSFVGGQNLLNLLKTLNSPEKYCCGLINTQVVPPYSDTRLPAVREYRWLMDTLAPPPPEFAEKGYTPLRYSFASFEGFLNAKALVALIRQMGHVPLRAEIAALAHQVLTLDIGIDEPLVFGPDRNQGLAKVYFTTVQDGRNVPIVDWEAWAK